MARIGGSTGEQLNVGNTLTCTWPGGLAAGDFAILVASWYEDLDDANF
jgi:predicted outer membrane lipoprotein